MGERSNSPRSHGSDGLRDSIWKALMEGRAATCNDFAENDTEESVNDDKKGVLAECSSRTLHSDAAEELSTNDLHSQMEVRNIEQGKSRRKVANGPLSCPLSEPNRANQSPVRNSTPINFAVSCANGDIKTVRALLEIQPSLATISIHNGYTGLHYAAKSGSVDIMQLLIVNGANVNRRTASGYTALHLAALCDRPRIIKALLRDHHADSSVTDLAGNTFDDYASWWPSESSKTMETIAKTACGEKHRVLPVSLAATAPTTSLASGWRVGPIRKAARALFLDHKEPSQVGIKPASHGLMANARLDSFGDP